jgi:hypothetical protein
MKSKLGVFSNSNALLVSFDLTHAQLATANAIAPEAFKLMEGPKGKEEEVFVLLNTANATADSAGVGFPFINEDQEKTVEVLFTVEGGDTQSIKYNAAKTVSRLEKVEKQIIAALKDMDKVAEGIEMIGFGE